MTMTRPRVGQIEFNTDLPIADGGTGASTAAAAFDNLKQQATTSASGVVELATAAEAAAGTDTTRPITPSTLRDGLNSTGTAPIYAARAWVNFNGTGTPSIRASGNVSSITDNGVGDYTINFTTSMTDANYAVVGSGTYNNSESWAIGALTTATYTSGFRVVAGALAPRQDIIGANIAVFR